MKEKKDNKRRAEAFLKRRRSSQEKIQDHHLTGTDQPFLPFMEQWLNEVERYSIRVTTLEQYKAVFRNVISIFPAFQNVALAGIGPGSLRPALHSLPRAASQRSHTASIALDGTFRIFRDGWATVTSPPPPTPIQSFSTQQSGIWRIPLMHFKVRVTATLLTEKFRLLEIR